MDRERCLEILKGYGVGPNPNMLRLIKYFWDNAELVCRAMGRYGHIFKAYRGVTQGCPLSPKLFNIMVNAIVREWLREVLGEDASMPVQHAAVHLFLALFYTDDAFIASTDPELLQEAMDVLVDLFERVGLRTNVSKTKAQTCIDGKIRTQLADAAYTNSHMGLHTQKEWDRRRVECDVCQKELAASSLSKHLET